MSTSFYVRRTSNHNAAGFSYSKALSANQAQREADAWISTGETCELIPVTPQARADVRRWEKVTRMDDAREIVTFQGQEMTFATYRLFHESI